MRLFLIKSRSDNCGYDCVQGFVVRASNSRNARKKAATKIGNEGPAFWLDTKKSSCRQIQEDGPTEIILEDYRAG